MEKPIFTKDKKLKIVYASVLMTILLVVCAFSCVLNPAIKSSLKNNFALVSNRNNILVHFIDVGQGDAVAINLPDGKVVLIDSGPSSNNVDYYNYIKEKVIGTKRNKKIDYLILTHSDADHIGGALKILNKFNVNTVFMPEIASNSETFQNFYDFATENCEIKHLGKEFKIVNNSYEILFLDTMNSVDANQSSQIIKVKFEDKSFLFMADAGKEVEEYLIDKYSNELDCDVLKVAHHGSKTSTGEDFLNVVSPKYSVISVGVNNYGHPNEEVLHRLRNVNSEILRTDKLGNIMFVLGSGYELDYLNESYNITSLSLRIEIFVIVIELILAIYVMVVIVYRKRIKKYKPKVNRKKVEK